MPRTRTLAEHFKGALAYAAIVKMEARNEETLVSPKAAELRAAVCANCKPPVGYNIDVPGSKLEQAEDEALKAKVGGRTTMFDEHLGKCGVCSCQLRTIVHLVPKILMVGVKSGDLEKYPDFCWKRKLND